MSEIAKDDLVMFVGNPHDLLCTHAKEMLGLPFTVVRMADNAEIGCRKCRITWPAAKCAIVISGKINGGARISWLKKIEPPPLEETTNSKEEMQA